LPTNNLQDQSAAWNVSRLRHCGICELLDVLVQISEAHFTGDKVKLE
jgi:hypothetical protein